MPVPVQTTGWTRQAGDTGGGAAGGMIEALPTAGPFARLAAGRAQPPAQAKKPRPAEAEAEAPPAQAAGASGAGAAAAEPALGVEVADLTFTYPGLDGLPAAGAPALFEGFSLRLRKGSCCLLLGANGAGKTTLMSIIAGKHMVDKSAVRVLGKPPFHATELIASGKLAYIGGTWQRDIAFAGYNVQMAGDITAWKMITGVHGVNPARRKKLMEVLDINPGWRLHMVSEGQRRRVQLCVGLLKEYEVLLLDEVTVDLDVLVRADLLRFLKEESETRGCTIVYATHIFDGMDHWADHVAYVARGQLQEFGPAAAYPELAEGRLVELVERWLRQEQAIVAELRKKNPQQFKQEFKYALNNGWGSGRLAATIKLSSNAVWRC